MTNGCLCCVLVGQMKEGLRELKEQYNPDRIIIETSGSAFPGIGITESSARMNDIPQRLY